MTKSILIVDDERHVRTLLEHTLDPLEEFGVELVSVESAEEALLKAATQPPTLAFIDVAMPEMNGYDLCDRLLEVPGAAHTRIVMLDDKGQEPDSDRCARASIVDYLTKPFDPDRILSIASDVLGVELES